ncbi:MAG: FKBP-type peptidyl-prolyl cis-trans isomerase [Solobacterium sp.]|nr:FKBP-type peptidyl-prolyl cis-trans isomerase [Solobacterium sp.]
MKIAVTYENGTVFQHFGRTQNFKIYEIENNQIISDEVIGNNGIGHEALADYLKEFGVEVLICGGMGQGAQNALAQAGIEVYAGAQGDADEAVKAYLAGTLENTGANCDHHDHENESEGCEGGDCGSCGGCGHQVIMEGPNAGKTVRVHYRGTLNDGTQFDSSYDRGTPLEFICGTGMMIPGFDKAVLFMEQGDKVNVHLMPEDAYGMPNPNAVFTVNISDIAGTENLTVGQRVVLRTDRGYPIPVRVTAKDETTITFDSNHEMAGKELNFEIELVEIL